MQRTYRCAYRIPLAGSGLRNVIHKLMPVGKRLWTRIPAGLGEGLWMLADPRSERGYTHGDHEPWLQDLLKAELGLGDCYYDLGAHTGFFCLIAARWMGPSGSVLAFEPDRQNATVLNANIARNHLTQRISVIEAAIWSSMGVIGFEQDSDGSNRTRGHVTSKHGSNAKSTTVRSISLDDVVFGECSSRPPNLIKLDLEGGEWDALQGARRVLTEIRPRLLCEVHALAQIDPIKNYLEALGYMTAEWTPTHPRRADYRQLYIWAFPRGSLSS
jgi:FkbM family methyltransferase